MAFLLKTYFSPQLDRSVCYHCKKYPTSFLKNQSASMINFIEIRAAI